MNINSIFIITLLCIIVPHTYTMESKALHSKNRTDYTTVFSAGDFDRLPLECVDTIIFSNKPQAIGAIKNACKRFAELASILRVDNQPIHQFIMPDHEERLIFFERIVSMDNPEYIKKTLEYGKRKAHLHLQKLESSTVIIFDEPLIKKEYLDREYLPFLLKYAIKNNLYSSVLTLMQNGADRIDHYYQTPLEYAAQCNSDHAITAFYQHHNFEIDDSDKALKTAWDNNNQKALDALNINDDTQNYIAILKGKKEDDQRSTCLVVTFGGSMVGTLALMLYLMIESHAPNNTTYHSL